MTVFIEGNSAEITTVPVSIFQNFDSFIAADPTRLTDNVHWGDVLEEKINNSIRIYYQNIHGITSDNTWDK